MSSKTESTLGGMRFKQYIFEDLVIQVSCHETPNVQVDISIEIFKPFFYIFLKIMQDPISLYQMRGCMHVLL